ncbi:helix-turn-helix domain-containing protein [Levilactobacillus sp. HBUAS70063]|uniref:helix-turn-helix domain-containing protein n=1 Tax=Levilactobacillus sp. HBUAS70063 TaxID=3109359 RepID=UPI003132A29C
MQSKFSEQLTLALDGIQGSLTHKQVAGKVHVSVGQLSRLKNGTRNTDKPTRISLADTLQNIWLNFSGAREDYHIPSFMKNKTKHDDVMAALFQQRKEENERRSLEESFDEAMTTKPELRSPQQTLLIRDYFQEYVEEIGAEETDIAMKAKYAGEDIQSVFDAYNKRIGG